LTGEIYQCNNLDHIIAIDKASFPNFEYPYFVIRQLYDLFKEYMLISRSKNEVNGYIIGAISSDNTGWVLSLAVIPQSRNKGIGKMLVKSLIDQFIERGLKKILLTVNPENKTAKRLFSSFGFTPLSTYSNYFGNGEPRILMELSL
jgi:ribosomal-protein-alanine N-acetyltransferase